MCGVRSASPEKRPRDLHRLGNSSIEAFCKAQVLFMLSARQSLLSPEVILSEVGSPATMKDMTVQLL